MPFQSRRLPPPRIVRIPPWSSTTLMSILSLTAIIYSYERNRRALDCKPSSLLAWDVRDEQSGSSGRHRVVQTRLLGNDIAARAPSSVRNKLRGLIARRLWRHLRRLACSESVDRL